MDSKECVKGSLQLDKKQLCDADSRKSQDTDEDDLFDVDVEPTYIIDSISNLQSTLEAIASSLSFLKDMSPCETLDDLDVTLHNLYSHLCQLEAIAASYAAVSDSTSCDPDRYIDPSIVKWLGNCMLCLLAIQAMVDEELDWRSKELSQDDELNLGALCLGEATVAAESGEANDSWTLILTGDSSKKQLVEESGKLMDLVDRVAGVLPAFAA
jgi:hypothetical protein